jgi:hypothetical protein
VTYVDSTPCANPTETTTPAVAPAALAASTCSVAAIKGRKGLFTVTSGGQPVTGGTLQVKLHRVHTPGSMKKKITTTYTGPVTKKLHSGRWHGTMVWIPPAGSNLRYCGIVFRNLTIKKASRHHAAPTHVKVPNSVSAGLRK